METKKLILLIYASFLLFMLMPMTSAACTINLNENNYSQSATATVTATCTTNPESGVAYTITWANATGFTLETDVGVTPDANGFFFETYVIPSNYVSVYGNTLNVTMTGSNLEGSDSAAVNSGSSTSLVIVNGSLSSQLFVGRVSAFAFTVIDENGKLITNARCDSTIEDGNNLPISSGVPEIRTLSGVGTLSYRFSSADFDEGKEYVGTVRCFCGASGTENECFDEDGTSVTNSYGSIQVPFTLNTWLTVNTVTDRTSYNMKDTIFICANVSNTNYDERIEMEITSTARCSAGDDNNSDRDRILVVGDILEPDIRGISASTTQMQCKRFVIPEVSQFEGQTSECYASTDILILNNQGERIEKYSTTSPRFNITSTELNVFADWTHVSGNNYTTTINLSASPYSNNYNGSGTGNIDIKLDSPDQPITTNERRRSPNIEFYHLFDSQKIKAVSATDADSNNINVFIEYLEDGNLELELRDVNINQSGYYVINLELEDFDNRSTVALEDIANKTGTFHTSINCPESENAGDGILCTLNAYVEEDGVQQRELAFTCSIDGNTSIYQFTQMITRNIFSKDISFNIPSEFGLGSQHTVTCNAIGYGLGSTSTTFSDTFTIVNEGGGGDITPNSLKGLVKNIAEGAGDLFKNLLPSTLTQVIVYAVFGLLTLFGIIMFLLVVKRPVQK